jgi:anaerobic selenocysteine-containing dehydrogenase
LEINRREFLKLLGISATSAAVGALGAGAIFSMPDEVFERINSGPHIETWKNSICTLCPGGCGIRVRQIDGIPVRILGNPLYPVNKGGVCPKAEAGIEMLFHPDRIHSPLKRSGERGENKWDVIDWEEALNIITNRLQNLRDNSIPERFVMMTRDNNQLITDLCNNFMASFGSPNHFCLSTSKITALPVSISQGLNTIPFYDIGNSNFLLNFDSDLLDEGPSPIHSNQLYAELHIRKEMDKAKIIHISSYLSRTAANSSDWVPIKPGTMAALALGIAHVMIRDGSYDKKFIKDKSFGFSGWQDSMGKWHKGFKDVVTKDYYPEKVSEITGVSAEQIIEIARGFASANPALALAGGQATSNTNSMYTLWAIYCLNALKGNLEKKGGVLFPNQFDSISLTKVSNNEATQSGFEKLKIGTEKDIKFVNSVDSIDQLLDALEEGQPNPIDTIFMHDMNPLLDSLNKERFVTAIKDVPLIVISASFFNHTVTYSDLILPEPVFLERWEASRNVPSVGFLHLGIQQPVMEPLYDTHHFGDVILNIKQKINGNMAVALPYEKYIGYIKSYAEDIFNSGRGTLISESMDLSWIEFLKQRGWQAFEYSNFEEFWTVLLERGGWWDPLTLESKNNKIYNNDSGKFEFFAWTIMEKIDRQLNNTEFQKEESEDLYRHWKIDARGDLIYLPHFEKPRFILEDPKYPYHLLPYQILSNYGSSFPSGLLSELSGLYSREYWNSWVEINPNTADSLNIDESEMVRVISPHGEISLRVRIVPTVMPEIIMMPLRRSEFTLDTLFCPDSDLMSKVPSMNSTKVRVEKMNMKVST